MDLTVKWNMANDQRPDHAWTTRWVKAHADDDKREHELTNEERGNVAADKLAETQYDAPLHIEKPWATTREGTVILETNIREYHAVTGNNTKTILQHTRRLNTRMALDRELTKIDAANHNGVREAHREDGKIQPTRSQRMATTQD